MIIGFTGTRETPSDAQLGWLYTTFETGIQDKTLGELHHGACVGADAAAHLTALDNGIRVVVHPPTDMKLVDPQCFEPDPLVTILPRRPYLCRNRNIVGATMGLIALPKHNEQPPPEQWGGTWYTVDFAERMNRPVIICYPNGRVEQRPNLPGI